MPAARSRAVCYLTRMENVSWSEMPW